MRVIGHRGTPTGPRSSENTLPALRTALEAGADGFEVDVRATRDGVLVLCHDPEEARALARLGVDLLCTDAPERVARREPVAAVAAS